VSNQLLIAGCSNAAGYEISGIEDCKHNRRKSFGNQLAKKMGLEPVNIALGASSNPAIVRSVREWIGEHGKPARVLVAFTELTRLDVPSPYKIWYGEMNPAVTWYNGYMDEFLQVNSGWAGANDQERKIVAYWHDYQVRQEKMMWLHTINLQWGLQNYLKLLGIPYTFCNTMYMYPNNNHEGFNHYCGQDWAHIDESNYMYARDNSRCFYWYYKNLGHENPLAKYWHHDETPHALYAEALYDFIQNGARVDLLP